MKNLKSLDEFIKEGKLNKKKCPTCKGTGYTGKSVEYNCMNCPHGNICDGHNCSGTKQGWKKTKCKTCGGS